MDARPALCEKLIDYAGLFPPAQLDVREAVAEYRRSGGGAWSWMLGRFIAPASRLAEISHQVGDEAIPLSVILDVPAEPRAWFAAVADAVESVSNVYRRAGPLRIEALEVALPELAAARDTFDAPIGQFGMLAQNANLRDLPMYAEFPRNAKHSDAALAAMPALARSGMRAKIRCGGLTDRAFPAADEIAAFIEAAREEAVPFKATAGLHHPIRAVDPATGRDMHGFLNLLAAALFARHETSREDLVLILEERTPAAFTLETDAFCWRGRCASTPEARDMRASGLVSYGSCSFEEPVHDLIQLGMLSSDGIPA